MRKQSTLAPVSALFMIFFSACAGLSKTAELNQNMDGPAPLTRKIKLASPSKIGIKQKIKEICDERVQAEYNVQIQYLAYNRFVTLKSECLNLDKEIICPQRRSVFLTRNKDLH